MIRVETDMVTFEIRLFNKLQTYARDGKYRFELSVLREMTFRDLLGRLGIPAWEVFLAPRNGRNIELFPEDDVLHHGEIIALSGPVPYSRGYGSPVV